MVLINHKVANQHYQVQERCLEIESETEQLKKQLQDQQPEVQRLLNQIKITLHDEDKQCEFERSKIVELRNEYHYSKAFAPETNEADIYKLYAEELYIHKNVAHSCLLQFRHLLTKAKKLQPDVSINMAYMLETNLLIEQLEALEIQAGELWCQLRHESFWNAALRKQFEETYFQMVLEFVKAQCKKYPGNVYPEPDEVFTWMRYCAVEPLNPSELRLQWDNEMTDVKVVILGQDPYPTAGYAHGLAFSCKNDIIPKSLKRIYEALDKDIGFEHPGHGDLTGWAKQGVLLLNCVLTVRTVKVLKPNKTTAKKENSHKQCLSSLNPEWKGGWETFTDAVIKYINVNSKGVVFMLWGEYAKKKASLINAKVRINDWEEVEKHLVLTSRHPGAFRKAEKQEFLDCKHFSKANKWLKDRRRREIDWNDL